MTARVAPLGLNYSVYGPGSFLIRRAVWSRNPKAIAKGIVRRLPVALANVQTSYATCRVDQFEGLPIFEREPRILFMTQVWDPARESDPELRAERYVINNTRAECIRRLRRSFPHHFLGGLRQTTHAAAQFSDCLLPRDELSSKSSYLRLMHGSSICIATTGLEGSVGWKMGEYVAAAKAIVSEPLRSAQPGGFAPGRNYLEFRTAEECVEAVTRLVESPTCRLDMMRHNAAYYAAHVRPDALVWNALNVALMALYEPSVSGRQPAQATPEKQYAH